MDRPKPDPFCFVNFPPDIWAYVVCFLSGEHLGRLKMTGSTLLWRKLILPGVVRSVMLGKDFIKFESWPAFLNEFSSLEELYIHNLIDSWWSKFGLRLDHMPSTLRKLRIIGPTMKQSDFFVSQFGRDLTLDKYIPHIEVLDLRQIVTYEDSWMAHTLPSLARLRIYSWCGEVQLPPSLIHFTTDETNLEHFDGELKLPPGLTTYRSHRLLGVEKLVPSLPPCLLKLQHSQTRGDDISFDQLPRSITSLKGTLLSYVSLSSPDSISYLPPTLMTLDVGESEIHSSTWAFLPRTLKKLSCCLYDRSFSVISGSIASDRQNDCELRTLPFDALPRSITWIDLFYPGAKGNLISPPSEPAPSSYFPPHLTYLSIDQLDMAPGTAKLLPSSLTHLRLGRLCEQVCKHLSCGLITLRASCALMSPNLIKFLPKTLTSLNLSAATSSNYWHDYNTGKRIKLISKLPNYAIHSSYGSNIDSKDDSSLPPNPISLGLNELIELNDTFIINQKLPNLNILGLSNAEGITDLSVPFLSRYLTSLSVHSSHVTGKSFALLPRSLCYLKLISSRNIYDSDIQHLPRTLIGLHLNSAVELGPNCVSDFPPHLEIMNLDMNDKITPSSIPNMPKLLKSSQSAYYQALKLWGWSICRGDIILKK